VQTTPLGARLSDKCGGNRECIFAFVEYSNQKSGDQESGFICLIAAKSIRIQAAFRAKNIQIMHRGQPEIRIFLSKERLAVNVAESNLEI
jgi:hypothetical protein